MKDKSNKLFLDNLMMLLKEKGISRNKMISDLNLSVSSFADWNRRGNIPSGEILKKIADYFNVSVDFLLGNEQKEKLPTVDGVELKQYEIELIEELRAASPEVKKMVLRSFGIDIDESEL